jgi:hypothetical protein
VARVKPTPIKPTPTPEPTPTPNPTTGWSKFKVITVIGWILISLRAGTYGLSQEILIISNLYGNLFLLGGLSIAAFVILKKN